MRIRKASALHEGLRKHFLPRNDSGPIDVSEDTLSLFTECMLTTLAWLTNYSAARRSLPSEFIGHWDCNALKAEQSSSCESFQSRCGLLAMESGIVLRPSYILTAAACFCSD